MAAWTRKAEDRSALAKEQEIPQVVQITIPDGGSQTDSFAVELRAVGQALEKFKFSGFELARRDGVYTITGSGAAALHATFSLIQFIRDFARGGKSKARHERNQVKLSYSRAEIEALDALERAKRKEATRMPDPYAASQILRGVGTFLDNRHATAVLGITYRDQWVTVLYKTADGRVEQEKQDLEYFYDYWVKMYLRRSNRPRPDQPSEPTLYVEWEENAKAHRLSRLHH